MAYKGQTAVIPLGLDGINSDDPQTILAPTQLISAKNITIKRNMIEKEPGSSIFNDIPLDGGVKAVYDFWPNTVSQRLIAVSGSGRVYKAKNTGVFTEILNTAPAPITISADNKTHILAGGAESAGRNKKLFIFTGKDPVQVISGDADVRTNMSGPAADWSGSNQPSFGFIHRGRIIAFGNPNDPHRLYISDDDNHETFNSGGATISVFPGEGERLFGGFVYKGRAFLQKFPSGIYYIDDSAGSDPTSWAVKSIASSFGSASGRSAIEVLDDVLIANSQGTINSLSASQTLGDVKAGDVLTSLRCETLISDVASMNGSEDRTCIYYSNKKQAMFTYRARGKSVPSGILIIDYSFQKPKVTWSDKDQPNCLTLRKDIKGIQRPIYGADDGHVYLMDNPMRNVGGETYISEFQTPHLDFSQIAADVSEKNKLFLGLEVTFIPTGKWDIYISSYIDGKYVETIPVKMTKSKVLGEFKLDTTRLLSKSPVTTFKQLHGSGKRISFKIYSDGKNQNFKLIQLKVKFKILGQQDSEDE